MPLTPAQEDNISSILSPTLTLPDNKDDFIKTTKHLYEAITTDVSDDHPFAWLSKCFRSPTVYIQGLEKLSTATTYVSDVQEFILSFVWQVVKEQADKLNVRVAKIGWDKKRIDRTCLPENEHVSFVSVTQTIDAGDHPWALPPLEGKCYTRSLRLAEREQDIPFGADLLVELGLDIPPTREFYVDVSVTLPNTKPYPTALLVCELPGAFTSDAAEDRFISSSKQRAEKCAEEYASTVLVAYLRQSSIHDKHVRHQALKLGVKKLVTIPYYFNEVLAKRLALNTFNKLTDNECKNLADPSVIDLIKNNVVNVDRAKSLTALQRKFATHHAYYPLLKENKISINSLDDLNEEILSLLSNPVVSNLIRQEKLAFNIAIALPSHTSLIFKNLAYSRYLAREDMDWETFSKLAIYHCKLMQYKFIVSGLLEGAIQLTDIHHYSIEDTLSLRFYHDLFYNEPNSNALQDVLKEIFASQISIEHVCLASLTKMGELIDANRALFDANFVASLEQIVGNHAQAQPTDTYLLLDRLNNFAETTLKEINKINILSNEPPADSQTLFSTKKRQRDPMESDLPPQKKARTDSPSISQNTKWLCECLMQMSLHVNDLKPIVSRRHEGLR